MSKIYKNTGLKGSMAMNTEIYKKSREINNQIDDLRSKLESLFRNQYIAASDITITADWQTQSYKSAKELRKELLDILRQMYDASMIYANVHQVFFENLQDVDYNLIFNDENIHIPDPRLFVYKHFTFDEANELYKDVENMNIKTIDEFNLRLKDILEDVNYGNVFYE